MALSDERRAALMAYCRLDDLLPEEIALLEACYDSAVGYMADAGVRQPQAGTPRAAQYDLCVNALTLDAWDHRGTTVSGGAAAENRAFRQSLNQLKLSEPPYVSESDTTA